MSSPQFQGTVQRPDLRAMFDQFPVEAQRRGLVASKVLPIAPMSLQSSNYSVLPLAQVSRIEKVSRASDGSYARGQFRHDRDSFNTQEYGFEAEIDERSNRIFATGFGIQADVIAANHSLSMILRAYEKRVAAESQNTTTFDDDAVGNGNWKNPSADILGDVKAAALKIKARTGLSWREVSVVIPDTIFASVLDNTGIINRINSTGVESIKRSEITPEKVAQALGIKEVIVPGAMYNTADEGQDATMADIWDNDKVFCGVLIPQGSTWEMTPGVGQTFAWDGDGGVAEGTMEQYWSDAKRSMVIRARHEVDEKVIYAACGHIITGTAV